MPYKDPERQRAYQREWSRTKRKKKYRPKRTTLERFDLRIDKGICIWHCLTPKPCRRKSVPGTVYCEKHGKPKL